MAMIFMKSSWGYNRTARDMMVLVHGNAPVTPRWFRCVYAIGENFQTLFSLVMITYLPSVQTTIFTSYPGVGR